MPGRLEPGIFGNTRGSVIGASPPAMQGVQCRGGEEHAEGMRLGEHKGEGKRQGNPREGQREGWRKRKNLAAATISPAVQLKPCQKGVRFNLATDTAEPVSARKRECENKGGEELGGKGRQVCCTEEKAVDQRLPMGGLEALGERSTRDWECTVCSKRNHIGQLICLVCGRARCHIASGGGQLPAGTGQEQGPKTVQGSVTGCYNLGNFAKMRQRTDPDTKARLHLTSEIKSLITAIRRRGGTFNL
ncbi:unnamed protein product [Discosporangium mesarthrocarpum]